MKPPPAEAGGLLSPGGLVTMAMMFVIGRLSGVIQPRYLIAVGAAIAAFSMYDLTNVYGDLGVWFLAMFVPIMTASYEGIPPRRPPKLPR